MKHVGRISKELPQLAAPVITDKEGCAEILSGGEVAVCKNAVKADGFYPISPAQ